MQQTTTWSEASRHHQNLQQVLQSYWQITKPRIIPLLLIETAAGMWVAAAGQLDPALLFVTLTSGALAAASAQVINCVYDRDIDYQMERTRHRPIPSGRIQIRDALVFALVLATLSFTLQAVFANLLSACLAMAGIAVYIGVYTHWLKRSSTQNIVIGGAAGAIPPLVGWAAVTGSLSWPAWVIFAVVFVWTPPHFWALALLIQEDYAKVGVPMLPVVVGNEATAKQIWLYTLGLVPITLLLAYPFGATGAIYVVIASALGGIFIKKAWTLLQAPQDKDLARSLFKYSILYMMLLSAGMVVDSLPISHQLVSMLSENLNTLASAIHTIG